VADLFVSYAREDQARVTALVDLLESRGWSVFWDRDIPPGRTWRSHIGQALEQARCVVVAWSEHSIRSDWVIDEAEEAKHRGVLVPVLLDAVRPPHGFRSIQAADLSEWRKDQNSPDAAALLAAIAVVLDHEDRTAEDARVDGPRRTEGDRVSDPADTAGVRRPLGLHGRWLVLGGLGAVAVLGAIAFLAWQVPPANEGRSAPGLEVSNQQQMDTGKGRIADPEEPELPPAPGAPDGLPGEVGEGKVLDLTADVVEFEGPVVELEGRVLPER
jgi:hypothetical protein